MILMIQDLFNSQPVFFRDATSGNLATEDISVRIHGPSQAGFLAYGSASSCRDAKGKDWN